MTISLPFPDKILWPNGRGHHMAKHRAFQKHKQWAHSAALAAGARLFRPAGERVAIRYTVTPKTAHAIDSDNAVAAMKAYQDGIALAVGVDDAAFAVPEIAFVAPKKPGGVEVDLG